MEKLLSVVELEQFTKEGQQDIKEIALVVRKIAESLTRDEFDILIGGLENYDCPTFDMLIEAFRERHEVRLIDDCDEDSEE